MALAFVFVYMLYSLACALAMAFYSIAFSNKFKPHASITVYAITNTIPNITSTADTSDFLFLRFLYVIILASFLF